MKKNTLYIIFLILIAMGVLVISVIGSTKNKEVSHVISIDGQLSYLSRTEIQDHVYHMVTNSGESTPHLSAIEEFIKQNDWVDEVQVYKDPQQNIKISITERTPILKVYRSNFSSFYIDKYLHIMQPLKNGKKPYVPTCLGFPSFIIDTNALHCLMEWTALLKKNETLSKEFSYFNYVDTKTIEMIPKSGTPIAVIPMSKEYIAGISKKLAYFYSNVLPTIGWDYYKDINFLYKNIVISTKN